MITAIPRILHMPDLLPRLVGDWALIPKCRRLYQSCNGSAMAEQWQACNTLCSIGSSWRTS